MNGDRGKGFNRRMRRCPFRLAAGRWKWLFRRHHARFELWREAGCVRRRATT
jgi:hypothetical protein